MKNNNNKKNERKERNVNSFSTQDSVLYQCTWTRAQIKHVDLGLHHRLLISQKPGRTEGRESYH